LLCYLLVFEDIFFSPLLLKYWYFKKILCFRNTYQHFLHKSSRDPLLFYCCVSSLNFYPIHFSFWKLIQNQCYLEITLKLLMLFEEREILIYQNALLYVEGHYYSLFAMFNIAKLEFHNWISVLIILLNAFVAVSPTNFSDRSTTLAILLSFLAITNYIQQVLHNQSEKIVLEYSLFLLAFSQLFPSAFLPTNVEAALHSPACKSISCKLSPFLFDPKKIHNIVFIQSILLVLPATTPSVQESTSYVRAVNFHNLDSKRLSRDLLRPFHWFEKTNSYSFKVIHLW